MVCYRTSTMKRTARNCCPSQPPEPKAQKIAFDRELARLCKALAHPARVQIVQLLLRKNNCMCGDIVEELPLAQSTISQHLKVLKLAGVIQGNVNGPRRCYCVSPAAILRLQGLLNDL